VAKLSKGCGARAAKNDGKLNPKDEDLGEHGRKSIVWDTDNPIFHEGEIRQDLKKPKSSDS